MRAARGKRHRTSVARIMFDLERVLLELEESLQAERWVPGPQRSRLVHDPKERRIHIAPFEDRIVHQALCAEIGPLLERSLIGDTYACRVGRGTHAALHRATGWARFYRYFVHLDVRKLFPAIDHSILFAQLERDVRCAKTLNVIEKILAAGRDADAPRFHFPGDDLWTPATRALGLPIGSLTSQHFANRFLSPMDHRAKDRLRIRPYLRYMDDMLLFANDREELAGWARSLEEQAWKLHLRLHPWEVRPTREGVNFLGFRILPTEVRVRRTSVNRARANLKRAREANDTRFPDRLRAVFAHWAHGDTFRLRTQVLRDLGLLASAYEIHPIETEPERASRPATETEETERE